MRDVGKLGEKRFNLWASEMNVVINPSLEDEKGWDFFIEIPDYLQKDYHLTKYPHPIKSFVQVKARDSRNKDISIKLSNWRNLVQNSNPTFIIVIEFLGEKEPQNVYLIHIWEELIKRYYDRISKISSPDKLNKQTMTVSYGKNELLATCDSHTVFKSIVECVNPNYQEYSIRKTKLINQYGYDSVDFSFTINFNLPEEYGNDAEEYLVDFALGIVDKIEPNCVQLHGDEVAGKKMWEDIKSVSFNRESIGKCQFKLRTDDYSKQIHLELDTFLPQGINHIVSKEKLKILFQGNFFYYTSRIHSSDSFLKFELPESDTRFSLHKVEKLCRLVEFLISTENSDQNLISETIIGDIHESSGKFQILENIKPEIIELFKTIRFALNVSDFFDIKFDTKISLNELLGLQEILKLANTLIEAKGIFTLEGMWTEEELSDDVSVATPIAVIFKLGEYHLYIGAIIIGKPKKVSVEDGKIYYHCRTNHAEILRKNITKQELPKQVKQDLKAQIYSYIENDDNLILVDLDSNHE